MPMTVDEMLEQEIGKERAHYLLIKVEQKYIICPMNDDIVIRLEDNGKDKYSSKCKLVSVNIDYKGTDKDGNVHEGKNLHFSIQEVWFRNRMILVKLANEHNYHESAWNELDQDRTYVYYKKWNLMRDYYIDQDFIRIGNGDLEGCNGDPEYSHTQNTTNPFTFGDDSVVSDLTDKEDTWSDDSE